MKAKTVTIIIVSTILALMWCSAAWAGRSNIRDYQQKQRIRQGIRSGEITRPEAQRLKKEQRRVDRAYHRALGDGHFNRRERQHVSKMNNRASRHIYRAKHNHARHQRAMVHNHNVYHYYPALKTGYADGYEFLVGVSNMGWRFAFSGWH